eukprot:TRINITY_DN57126_c0_g1_i1.p1 TRINITY_DN57126_c0_g1~~TRINITY_DN57126_c0_g1_i1.p1  ORF type:complete len:283 (-),score=59.71 TRINITY_DN57126_c0_g1_i1:26-844(-)
MEQSNRLRDVVNVEKYPVDDVNTQEFRTLLKKTRETYEKDGIVTLPKFILQEAIEKSVAEVERAKGSEWFTKSTHNVFLDSGDDSFSKDHIRNRELPTTVASLAYDRLDINGPLLTLYHSDSFCVFLAQVLGMEHFYRLADPLGAASINIFPPGTAHNWHFDESVFSVTIMIQKPESGGLFRHTNPIREKGNETDNLYEVIEDIVDKKNDIASTLKFEPGTLSIFSGSRCLHEVTEVYGDKDRLVAVFCFATKKGVRNSAKVQELFWGRVVD